MTGTETTPRAMLRAELVEMEADRIMRATATDRLAVTATLTEHDRLAAAVRAMTDTELAMTIRDEHHGRDGIGGRRPLDPASPLLVAAIDEDRRRTREHHQRVADADREAHDRDSYGPPSVYCQRVHDEHQRPRRTAGPLAPMADTATATLVPVRVATLARDGRTGAGHYWHHVDRYRRNVARLRALVEAEADRRRARVGGPFVVVLADGLTLAVDPADLSTAHVLPDVLDGGALVLATHRPDEHGQPVPAPHWQRVASVVAQPADARATARPSATWRGGTGRVEDPEAGALADTARSTRQAGRAAYGPDGYNLTVTRADGTTVRMRATLLRAARAIALHEAAGTVPPAYVLHAPAATTVVGALVTGQPHKRAKREAVAVDYVRRLVVPGPTWTDRDGRTHRTSTVRSEVRTYVRTRPLAADGSTWTRDDAGQYVPVVPVHVLLSARPHTARRVTVDHDRRTEADRRAADPTRAARRAAAKRHQRVEAARAVVVEAVAAGKPVTGRADALHVRLARAAEALAVAEAVPMRLAIDRAAAALADG